MNKKKAEHNCNRCKSLENALEDMLQFIEELRIRAVRKYGDKGEYNWDEKVILAIKTLEERETKIGEKNENCRN